ncbi:MAG: hypothetical protein ACP5UB_06595 [Candidatus Sumerlaeaceae bacterium]|jgi:hypothetical protein
MEDYSGWRCPKCGELSQNEEICDYCGAVFSKVREREYAGETYARPPASTIEQQTTGSGGRVLFLVVIFVIIAGGIVAGLWIWRTMTPQTIDDLISAHRKVTKRARQVIADEIEAHKSLPEHKSLYIEVLDLAASVSKLSEQKNITDDMKIQFEALSEANSRLAELLNMSPEEFVATAAKLNYADPFAEVDEKLAIAQNPELAKKRMNPLMQVLDILRIRALSGTKQE